MFVAMGVGALLCIIYGIFPSLLYNLLPYRVEYHPYTLDHVVSGTELLIGTGLAFWLLHNRLAGEPTITLDTDWFYRRPLAAAIARLIDGVRALGESASALRATLVQAVWAFTQQPSARGAGADPHAEDYDPYRFRRPIGATVFWVVVYFVVVAVATLWML